MSSTRRTLEQPGPVNKWRGPAGAAEVAGAVEVAEAVEAAEAVEVAEAAAAEAAAAAEVVEVVAAACPGALAASAKRGSLGSSPASAGQRLLHGETTSLPPD